MLWEIIFEMMGELLSSFGEMLKAFFWLIGSIFKSKKNATEEEKRKKRQSLMILGTTAGLVGLAFMFPGTRDFFFHGGSQRMLAKHGPPIVEMPRSNLPMQQYTVPALFNKKRVMLEDDDGLKRIVYFYWHAPKPAHGGRPAKLPLVVVLHDRTGLDAAAIYLRMEAVQKYFPAYLLMPQSPAGNIWDAPAAYAGDEGLKPEDGDVPGENYRSIRDVPMLMAMLSENIPIDLNRMYIIGCDSGADGVYGALTRYPGLFAAGVAIGGKWSFLDRAKLAKTPLLILHGGQDPYVPPAFAGKLAQLISASKGDVAYHEFPALNHDCDASSYYSMAVWKWMFSQSLSAKAGSSPSSAAAGAPPAAP